MEDGEKDAGFISSHKYFDFVTPSLMKLLGLFLSEPASRYHIRELAKRLDVSPAFVSKRIGSLVKAGILSFDRIGQLKVYKLNLNDPIVKQLKIAMNIYHLEPFLRAVREYSDKIVLFGSCSFGTDTKDSDVDVFAVVKNKVEEEKLKRKAPVSDATDRKISLVTADPKELVSLEDKDVAFYNNIRKGIVLWDRVENV